MVVGQRVRQGETLRLLRVVMVLYLLTRVVVVVMVMVRWLVQDVLRRGKLPLLLRMMLRVEMHRLRATHMFVRMNLARVTRMRVDGVRQRDEWRRRLLTAGRRVVVIPRRRPHREHEIVLVFSFFVTLRCNFNLTLV